MQTEPERAPRRRRGRNSEPDAAVRDMMTTLEPDETPPPAEPATDGPQEEEETPREPPRETREARVTRDVPAASAVARTETATSQTRSDDAPEVVEVIDAPEVKIFSPASTKKLGNILGRKVPGAESIEIMKRLENGSLAFVGKYNAADLSDTQNVHGFLDQYVKPNYGPGEYQVYGVAADGKRYDCGTVNLLEPKKVTPTREEAEINRDPVLSMLRQLIDRNETRLERELRAQQQQKPQPQVDPIETIERLQELRHKLAGASEGGQTALLMDYVAKSEERMSRLIETMKEKREEPALMTLLQLVLDKSSTRSEPMPPPPPPPDPTIALKNLAETVRMLMPPQQNNDNARLYELLLERADKDKLGLSDVLAVARELRGEQGSSDLRKALEDVSLIRNFTEPSGGGFWDGFKEFANSDLATALAGRIRPPDLPRAPAAAPALPSRATPAAPPEVTELRRKEIELRKRQLRLMELELEKRERELLGPQNGPSEVIETTQVPQGTESVETPTTAAPVDPAERERFAARVRAHGGGLPPLPPEIGEKINAFLVAEGDAALVDLSADLIVYLADFGNWSTFRDAVLTFVGKGEPERAFAYVEGLFLGLGNIEMLDEKIVGSVLAAVKADFDRFVSLVAASMPEGGDESAES